MATKSLRDIASKRQEKKLKKTQKRLDFYMDLQERDALKYSNPAPKVTRVIHFRQLALYQARGWELLQITTVAVSVQKATIQIDRAVLEERHNA